MSLDLSPQEQRVIERLRQLPPAAVKEVENFAIFLAARALTWSYSGLDSLARATDLMASDPFLRREIEAINAEFAATEPDGLEDY